MRSNLTVDELEIAAMLMGDGYSYDPWDHTFCFHNGAGFDKYIDPETLEFLNYGDGVTWQARKEAVRNGTLGASDAVSYTKEKEGRWSDGEINTNN